MQERYKEKEEDTNEQVIDSSEIDFNDTLSDVGEVYSGGKGEDEDKFYSEESDVESYKGQTNFQSDQIDEDGTKYTFINNIQNKKAAEYSPIPLIKNQKDFPNLRRIYARRVKMFDLAKREEEDALNNLMDNALKEDSNIVDLNLRHEFSEKSGSWKILATYSLVEFKTNITNK